MVIHLYIDGKLVPKKNIESIRITDDLVIWVVLLMEDEKERLYTDSTIRKIELKYEQK